MNEESAIALENARKKLKKTKTGAFTRAYGQGLFAEFGDELLAGLKSGFSFKSI